MNKIGLFVLRAISGGIVLACVLIATVASAQRLPMNVTPTHYTLTLAPDLKAAAFTGVEKIDVNIAQPTSAITLNAAEIKFESVEIVAGGTRQTATVTLDADKQQATFTVPNEIAAGTAVIEIHYTGILNNELRGFYLSKTARRNYAVSQFEPTDARRAFPSFDEPAFKAKFDVTLVVDSGDTAISNGPIVSDTPGPEPGKHTLVFGTTPKMSTYLVAFLVGDFQCTAGSSDGVAIRVCATPDKVALTPFALDIAKFVLHYYNNYFGIPYPLKKLDLIAIPDFEAGAMENFGAITYRETELLLDPKTASMRSKRNVGLVVAHEMAHQWFGDLVTMDWWNNIWLNEGFATWMENKPVAAMHPEWNVDQMVAADKQDTLNLDSQPTTRPIRAPLANTPDEINQLFDGISYGKAGAVLLMVENYLGPETFRQGVHNYLAAHEYGNATAEDFWNAQTATSHKPVDKIMESLVVQPGVPLLTFGEPAAGKVPVEQKRFFLDPGEHADADQKWTVPVCFADRKAHECSLLTPSDASVKIRSGASATPVFFANADGKGYYRSAYAPAQYRALVKAAESGLTPTERISLGGDEWARVHTGDVPVGDFLDLAGAFRSDSDAEVFSTVSRRISTVYFDVAADAGEREALSAWVRRTFGPEYKKLGAPEAGDSPNKQQLRASLFSLLGYIGEDPAVLADANRLANQYLDNPSSVEPTLAQTALAVAAENGDAQLYDRLQNVYESSHNPEFQETALRLLATFKKPALENRALNYAVSDKVRNQDAAFQFAIAMQDPDTRDEAWKFIKSHWDQVHAQLTTALGADLVLYSGSFCSADGRDDVENFYKAHPVEAADVSLKRAVEHMNGCIQLRSAQEANLKQWLEKQPGV